MSKILMSNGRYVSKYGAMIKTGLNSDVKIYVPFTGTNGQTSATDLSPNAYSMTFNGGATISTAQSYYGTGSLLCSPAGRYVSTPINGLGIGTNAFTFKFKVYPTAYSGHMFSHRQDSTNFILTMYSHPAWVDCYFRIGGVDILGIQIDPISLNAWHDIVLTRDSNSVWKWYVDGVSKTITKNSGSYSVNISDLNGNFNIGDLGTGASTAQEYYQDVLLVVGESWMPDQPMPKGSTLPIPISKSYSNSLYDAMNPYMVACWNFDKNLTSDDKGTNTLTNTNVTAGAGKNFNGAVYAGNGMTEVAYSSGLDWPGDFTVFCWMKFSSLANTQSMMINYDYNDSYSKWFRFSWEGGFSRWRLGMGSTTWTYDDTLATDTWYLMVIERSSGVLSFYRNNVQLGTDISDTSDIACDPTKGFSIGFLKNASSPTYYFTGTFDEIGIIKGLGLNASQRLELYNNGAGKFFRKKSGVII